MEQPAELTAEVPRVWDRPAVTVPVLAVAAVVGGQLPSFSTAANVYSLGAGGVMMWLGLSRRVARRPAPVRLAPGSGWWLVPVAVLGFFEGSTYLLGSAASYPTLSKLADPLLADPLLRSVGYFAWLSVFWALVRR